MPNPQLTGMLLVKIDLDFRISVKNQ
jgi:hypothetical protein